MRSKTFPKENVKKLNETIRDLKALLKQKEKEIKFLRDEVENLMKPVRVRKNHQELTHEQAREDFVKRLKREVFGEKG